MTGRGTSRLGLFVAIGQFCCGVTSIIIQLALLVCAIITQGSGYLVARLSYSSLPPSSTLYDIKNYLKDNQNTAARGMAFASLGFFVGILYLAVGVFAFRWNTSSRPGTPAALAGRQSYFFKWFKILSIIGIPLSLLLLAFSVYLCYLMSFWYESAYILQAPFSVTFPVMLHAAHAANALFGLLVCIVGVVAKQSVPQQTMEMTQGMQPMWNPQPMVQGYLQQQPGYGVNYNVSQQSPMPQTTMSNDGKRPPTN
ncbi:hypothetical protein BV898_12151 [Hypsibius exemplaris]|uniref:Uncharacterized protein n=1 Tax=Hypsibius exemplaris TaxID=2072580 RepID=A0A1W0WEJ7_HYPEX|nr:hypothetical protein BV898_12151 [Hypsibius exemplaris]